MAEVTVKVGKKMSDAEVKAVDPKEIGQMTSQPKKSEVEAEYLVAQRCPYCGCIGYGDVSPYVVRYFTCHCCGGVFTM